MIAIVEALLHPGVRLSFAYGAIALLCLQKAWVPLRDLIFDRAAPSMAAWLAENPGFVRQFIQQSPNARLNAEHQYVSINGYPHRYPYFTPALLDFAEKHFWPVLILEGFISAEAVAFVAHRKARMALDKAQAEEDPIE